MSEWISDEYQPSLHCLVYKKIKPIKNHSHKQTEGHTIEINHIVWLSRVMLNWPPCVSELRAESKNDADAGSSCRWNDHLLLIARDAIRQRGGQPRNPGLQSAQLHLQLLRLLFERRNAGLKFLFGLREPNPLHQPISWASDLILLPLTPAPSHPPAWSLAQASRFPAWPRPTSPSSPHILCVTSQCFSHRRSATAWHRDIHLSTRPSDQPCLHRGWWCWYRGSWHTPQRWWGRLTCCQLWVWPP